MAHPYSKEAKAGHDRKLKAYGGQSGNQPLTHAGFPALNTDTQAGRAPLNSEKYIPPETTARTARKKGGRVAGAESLKRLDKAPRKGSKSAKHPTGARAGEVPTGTSEQVEFDPTNKFEAGEMNETSLRKRGGKVSHIEWEHSKKDLNEDRKLAKKYHMPLEKWEDSALDKKHDKQQSMEGLKKGGKAEKACYGGRKGRATGGGAFDDYMGGSDSAPKSGGKKGASKTVVNIMVGGQQPQQQQPGMDPMLLAALAGAGGPGAGAPPAPPPAPPAGAMPPAAMAAPMPPAPVGGAPQMPPGGMPMPRKDGGKVQVPYKKPGRKDEYPAMDFGSGGGFGRKQKVDAYGEKPTPYNKDNY